jgi:hypothetical protein
VLAALDVTHGLVPREIVEGSLGWLRVERAIAWSEMTWQAPPQWLARLSFCVSRIGLFCNELNQDAYNYIHIENKSDSYS